MSRADGKTSEAISRLIYEESPLTAWASFAFKMLSALPEVIASPPTAAYTPYSNLAALYPECSHPWDGGAITPVGGSFEEYESGVAIIRNITNSDDSASDGGVTRFRFYTDAPEFEIVTAYTHFASLNLMVDGRLAKDGPLLNIPSSGGTYYTLVSFGASLAPQRFEFLSNPGIVAGGSGYAVGDTITIAGGTFSSAAVYRVVIVGGGGVVAGLQIESGGNYSVLPSGTLTVVTTSGSGSGLQVSAPFSGSVASANKFREIEVAITGEVRVRGINVFSEYKVFPAPVPKSNPKVCFVGDSQSAGTYLKHATSHMPLRIARRLGLYDAAWLSAQGGTGWATASGFGQAWSSADRIADFIRIAADVYVFIGSQNDANNSTTQAAVTATLNALTAALPNAVFVGIGSVLCSGSTSIKAGWLAANNQERIAYLDNVSTPWLGSGIYRYMTNDGQHLSHEGTDLFADIAAAFVSQAMQTF